jgi:hypothetical protein
MRDGYASVFHRDEIAGLFAMINRREHMAGMMEMYTRLYDGGAVKRTLRSQTITVQQPIFIFFGGGIRSKVYQELTEAHIESGFLPRFVFILADTDKSRFRPLGPPTEESTGEQKQLVNKLSAYFNWFSRTEMEGAGILAEPVPAITNAKLSPEAWERYQQLETRMVEDGLSAEYPELCLPMYQRLTTSILKAAVLIASSRAVGKEEIRVEVKDLLKAIYYGKQWRGWANEVLNNTGTSQQENKMSSILRLITREATPAQGVPKSTIMRRHKLMSKDADNLLNTLMERELVRGVKKGNTWLFWPKGVVS